MPGALTPARKRARAMVRQTATTMRRGPLARLAGVVDSVVDAVSPAHGFARRRMRDAAIRYEAISSFGGAGTGRFLGDWIVSAASADADLLPDLPMLRQRARDLVRNDGNASGIIETIVTNVIGCGIKPQSRVDTEALGIQPDAARPFQRAAERAFARWCPHADVTGHDDWYGLERLAFRSWLESGEVLALFVALPERAAFRPERPYSLAVQLIEADRLASPFGYSTVTTNPDNDNEIRDGVEIDGMGRPVAYWIRKRHPGDTLGAIPNPNDFDRITAFDSMGRPRILHLFPRLRVGQSRGYPIFAAILELFRHDAKYFEAELIAARVASCFAAIVTRSDAGSFAPNPLASGETGPDGEPMREIFPGTVDYLAPGESITQLNPSRPNAQFGPFIEQLERKMAASIGFSFEGLFRNYSKTNFSSARAALLGDQHVYKVLQSVFAQKLCQPTWSLVLLEALLRDELPLEGKLSEAWTGARWIGPGYGYVRPDQEVKASIEAIGGGLSTLADECASTGRDWEETLEQLARERDKRAELGLDDPTAPEPADPNAKDPDEEDAAVARGTAR